MFIPITLEEKIKKTDKRLKEYETQKSCRDDFYKALLERFGIDQEELLNTSFDAEEETACEQEFAKCVEKEMAQIADPKTALEARKTLSPIKRDWIFVR